VPRVAQSRADHFPARTHLIWRSRQTFSLREESRNLIEQVDVSLLAHGIVSRRFGC
jgi:hypothetical protein